MSPALISCAILLSPMIKQYKPSLVLASGGMATWVSWSLAASGNSVPSPIRRPCIFSRVSLSSILVRAPASRLANMDFKFSPKSLARGASSSDCTSRTPRSTSVTLEAVMSNASAMSLSLYPFALRVAFIHI